MTPDPIRIARTALLLSLGIAAGLVGCQDDNPTPTGPGDGTATTTTAPVPASTGLLRAAQLTVDARTVDVAVDGEVVFRAVAFPGVSSYLELPAGEHRVQFFPAGSTRAAILEDTIAVSGGEALTVAILGNSPLELVTILDDRSTTAGAARARLVNAVADFPASLDLAVVNGPLVVSDVAFREASSYESLIPGIYAFTLERGGTSEDLATLTGAGLPTATASTVFAVGSLARGDIRLVVARDAG
jgi:hypothetical protein